MFFVFFSSRIFFHGYWWLTGQQGKGGDSLFISFYDFHPLTNIQTFILQLCTWNDYHIFLIAPLLVTRLLLGEIYHLIELSFDWLCDVDFCLLVDLIQGFCCRYLTLETSGLELALTIILVLQANQLTMCGSCLPSLVPHVPQFTLHKTERFFYWRC